MTSVLVAVEIEVERGRRVASRAERYRVTAINDWDSAVISRVRYRTLRAAQRAQSEWERTGVRALLEIVRVEP